MTDPLATNDNDNDDVDLDGRLIEEFLRPGRGGRLATLVGGCRLIDITDLGYFPTLSPPPKVLLLFLLLCLKDRATELRIDLQDTHRGDPGVCVSYVVNCEVYELVPPPFEVAIEIIQEIKVLAGLMALGGRARRIWRAVADRIVSRFAEPTYGGFRLGAGGRVSDITVMVQPSSQGDRVLMQISAVDPEMARIAQTNLRQLFADRRNGAGEGVADGPITG
jgi:hypothetical protein